MAFVLKQGGRTDYNYKEYMLDKDADLTSINVKACSPGSVAYVIESGNLYILNNNKEWILQ